ncbi:MAG: PD40 domain-containing protein [Spirochaetales bacterium]|nr:PD40 domain-containing protein [Spirochaetales bacterium]
MIKRIITIGFLFLLFLFFFYCCARDDGNDDEVVRPDGAKRIGFSGLPGSCQNAAWSPAVLNSFVFTNFRSGYNEGDAYLYICDLDDNSIELLLDGYNVTMPGGACIWNPVVNKIVFSSERNDESENAYQISPDGTGLAMISDQAGYMAWEPGFSPDGTWIVYERVNEADTEHFIYACEVADSSNRIVIDDSGDCRQPSWSPRGDYICYQKDTGSIYEIMVCDDDGSNKRQLLDTDAESTDCSFSPDGDWIVFSSEYECDYANIYICTSAGGMHTPDEWIRVTEDEGYDGAPGWSQDGARILFEHTDGDPDSSSGSEIWMIDVPALP